MQFPIHIPFVEDLGITLNRLDEGEAELALQAMPRHHNSFGFVQGGVCMTMLDVSMILASRSPYRNQQGFGPGVVTLEMKTTFFSPGWGVVRVVGKLLHRTSSVSFCEASMYDAKEIRCAHATATFKYLRESK